MGDAQLTLTRTGDRAPCRAPSRSTADRVAAAWQHSPLYVRHLLIAACATSIALAWWASGVGVEFGVAGSGVLLALAAFVDLRERRLPNRLLGAAFVAAFVGAALAADLAVLGHTLMGMATAGGAVLLVHLTRGVGMGDVKMAGVVGASVGCSTSSWFAPPAAVAIAALAAALFGIIAQKQRVVLGPSLWLGWATTLCLHGIGWSS